MAQDNNKQSPLTRPGFVAAAVGIALIVILGLVIVIVIMTMTQDSPGPAPTTSASPAPTTAPGSEPAQGGDAGSVCGLPGEVLEGRLTTAPDAEWEYQGTIAYPTSPEFGPGATAPEGFRYCFQHSPEGALFAAANAIATGTDQSLVPAWIEYFASKGANRGDLVPDEGESDSNSGNEGTRLRITGFRLLAYNENTARVDLAVHGSTPNGTVNLSMVYELVWEDGDWKLNTDSETPIDVAAIPDTSGYVIFGE